MSDAVHFNDVGSNDRGRQGFGLSPCLEDVTQQSWIIVIRQRLLICLREKGGDSHRFFWHCTSPDLPGG